MRLLLFALLATLGVAPCARAADGPLLAAAKALDKALQDNDCAAGLPAARTLIGDAVFERLPDGTKLAALSFAANCAVQQRLYEEAYADARQGTALTKSEDWLWAVRVELAIGLDRPDDALDTVRELTSVSPPALNAVRPGRFLEFEHNEAARRRNAVKQMFALLEASNYTPADPTLSPDRIWLDYARLLADDGEADHAAALVRRVTEVNGLISVSLDRRFAAIVAAEPTRFDLRAAQERQLARDQAAMKRTPNSMALLVETVRDLRALERFDEALALDQSAIDRANHSPKGKPAFTDQDRQLNWALDFKADILDELGRHDEALDIQRAAAKLDENRNPNVSQVINFAGSLVDAGRPEEALRELTGFDGPRDASPYGTAWVHTERACAFQQLGRRQEMATEIAFLDAHASDNPGARLKAHLCANDLDGAAAAIIDQLNDPLHSDGALLYLSEFDVPRHDTPIQSARAARFALVAARPDVQAAAAKAGAVRRIPLCRDVFVDTD
jgi:tetratricopeptide (TPR) repeat protein